MGDVQTSIDSLAKLNFEASDNWLLNKFASSADSLNVYTVKDIKQKERYSLYGLFHTTYTSWPKSEDRRKKLKEKHMQLLETV